VKVGEFRDEKWAINELNECIELMKKFGKMPKDEFINKMRTEHPEKYC
jgi:inorganic pyrophosphatase